MTTIDELLATARRWLATVDSCETLEDAARCAQIARANAATAQAMILNERGTLTIERIGEYVKATVGMYSAIEVTDNAN